MDFTEEQKFQMALAYAHAIANKETSPEEFINCVYLFLNTLNKPENAKNGIDIGKIY